LARCLTSLANAIEPGSVADPCSGSKASGVQIRWVGTIVNRGIYLLALVVANMFFSNRRHLHGPDGQPQCGLPNKTLMKNLSVRRLRAGPNRKRGDLCPKRNPKQAHFIQRRILERLPNLAHPRSRLDLSGHRRSDRDRLRRTPEKISWNKEGPIPGARNRKKGAKRAGAWRGAIGTRVFKILFFLFLS